MSTVRIEIVNSLLTPVLRYSVVAVSIGASRMYRGLADGANPQSCCPPVSIEVKERTAETRTRFPGPSQASNPGCVAEGADDAAGEVLISSHLKGKDDMV